jgi:serine/threonine protein kinase
MGRGAARRVAMTSEVGQPGQIIDGKYRIVRMLGTGGMGAVFEGENLRIRRKVAIKMLHGSVSSQPDVIARFEREAQAAALVGSDHICEVLDLGMLPDQTRYMVMEYLDGDTLSGLIKKAGRLAPLQSIPILLQILDALGAAHAAGIIHRDLKPDNVFILPLKGGVQNFVKILDFGVSKFSQLGGEAMNVTRAGAVVGTPYYMSPEQARGSSAIDNRTDVYAIGVLLYQATTGQVPYQAETFNELLFKIVLEVAPPPQTYVPNLDPEFAAIIQRAMAREPAERYQSCQQFHAALVQYQTMRTGSPPPGLPKIHDGAPMMRTEMLDLSSIPGRPIYPSPASAAANAAHASSSANNLASSPSWPGLPAATEGTMPMQPGLQLGGPSATGLGGAMSPMASGANWGSVSVPGAAPTGNTANSWGNASSPSNAIVRPRRGNGMLIAVVFVAALVGVGVAVAAFFMIGKPEGAGNATQPSATATATVLEATAPVPSGTAEVTPTPSTAPTASAASTASTAAVAPVDSAVPSVTSAASSAHPAPGPMPTGASTVKGSTGRQNGPGTTKPLPKSGGKSGGTELGY